MFDFRKFSSVRASWYALAIGLSTLSSGANAALLVDIEEVGDDVVFTTSGSLNLSGLTAGASQNWSSYLNTVDGFLIGNPTPTLRYAFATNSGPIASVEPFRSPSSNSGTQFGVNYGPSGFAYIPSSYVSGAELSASSTFANTDFSALGLNVGSYVYTLGNGSMITVQVGPNVPAVPEPATWALLVLGFGGVGASLRRANRVRAAYA